MIGDMHFELIGSIMREVFVISGKLPSRLLILTDSKVNYNVILELILNSVDFYRLYFELYSEEKKKSSTNFMIK